ncbi:helix-turn-helix domain-containing protein [Cryptosporangium minutisporangium]|uniref:Helix-turn-helix domain-containing protein n=1 Tax=Cryptosporangium minutisporangium TaxID=113569 RepID=A0ABP6SX66_9ACTN
MGSEEPSRAVGRLAYRLRALRTEGLAGQKLSQAQVGQLLGGDRPLSAPLISSWERTRDPVLPPEVRLRAYARLFATDRAIRTGRLLDEEELNEHERERLIVLERELLKLREEELPDTPPFAHPFGRGTWRFEDGQPVTIVASEMPERKLGHFEYAQKSSPDYVELYRYADLDAMVELYGHLRAANPQNTRIRFRTASGMLQDDSASHLILLGGIDWNSVTRDLLGRLNLPVRQISGADRAVDGYFEVDDGEQPRRFAPRVEGSGADTVLYEDVALFYRGPSPLNRRRTLTICNAMYGRGTLGVVMALTDAWYRDQSEDYLRVRFATAEEFCLLVRVPVFAGNTVTPDWSHKETRLFEWSRGHR